MTHAFVDALPVVKRPASAVSALMVGLLNALGALLQVVAQRHNAGKEEQVWAACCHAVLLQVDEPSTMVTVGNAHSQIVWQCNWFCPCRKHWRTL